MAKNKKILLILGGIIIAILIGFVLSNQQPSLTQEEKVSPQQEYPDKLLEGVVKAINNEEGTLILEAKTGLIKTSQEEISEKTIKLTEDTVYEIYQMDTKEETSCEFSEIKVDDNILVWTLESTYEEINNLEEFTAAKITKMVAEIKIPNE
jgi:hypothetical protein